MKRYIPLAIILFLFTSYLGFAQSIIPWSPDFATGRMHFIVANDLGRNGYYDQKSIAELMGEVAEPLQARAVLAVGDVHHFEGIESTADPLWQSNFEQIYRHPGTLIEWYAVAGNHEYRGRVQPLIDYRNVSRRWMMPARYYAKTFSSKGVSVKVIFLDTTPLIDLNRQLNDDYPEASQQPIEPQLHWLEQELKNCDAQWLVVAGHHPIYADSPKYESEQLDMRARVDTLLRRYGVDMYLCGHIHNFQHVRLAGSPTEYILNSSASQSRRSVKPIEGTQFYNGSTGFSVLSVGTDTLSLYMINNQGNLIYTIKHTK